jgi:hypothetical protein
VYDRAFSCCPSSSFLVWMWWKLGQPWVSCFIFRGMNFFKWRLFSLQ